MSLVRSRIQPVPRLGTGRSRRRFWLTQAGVLAAAIVVYFGVRTLTEGSPATAARNAGRIIDLERSLGLHVESTMQEYVVDHDGLARLANWIYIWGHLPVIIAVLAWLVVRVPDRYTVYRDAMLISGLVGIVIFATFPVAPPRLLDLGMTDTVTEQSHAYRVLQPPSLVNQFAAMPSFHAGWDLLMGIALVREGRRIWVRVLGCLLPIAMGLSVVVTANHYLLDVVVGMAIVAGALVVAHLTHTRRVRRRFVLTGPDPYPQPVTEPPLPVTPMTEKQAS